MRKVLNITFYFLAYIIHFILSIGNCVILVSVAVELEAIIETLGVRQEYTLNASPSTLTHIYSHTHTRGNL